MVRLFGDRRGLDLKAEDPSGAMVPGPQGPAMRPETARVSGSRAGGCERGRADEPKYEMPQIDSLRSAAKKSWTVLARVSAVDTGGSLTVRRHT